MLEKKNKDGFGIYFFLEYELMKLLNLIAAMLIFINDNFSFLFRWLDIIKLNDLFFVIKFVLVTHPFFPNEIKTYDRQCFVCTIYTQLH